MGTFKSGLILCAAPTDTNRFKFEIFGGISNSNQLSRTVKRKSDAQNKWTFKGKVIPYKCNKKEAYIYMWRWIWRTEVDKEMGKEVDKEVSKESDKEVDKEMGWAFLRPVMRAQVRRGGGSAQPMIATGNAKIAGSLYNCRCLTAVIHGYTSNDTKRYTQTPQAFKILFS